MESLRLSDSEQSSEEEVGSEDTADSSEIDEPSSRPDGQSSNNRQENFEAPDFDRELRPYMCGLCYKLFKWKVMRNSHIERQHSATCKPEFVDEYEVKRNMVIFDVVFVCNECDEEFNERLDLEEHWLYNHVDDDTLL